MQPDHLHQFYLFRNYTGPTNIGGDERRSRNYGSRGQYSPVIEIDEDSHSKFINESGAGRSGRGTSTMGPKYIISNSNFLHFHP